ncbi:unnamed protein product [Gadus morhua 'NCC']
MGYRSQFPALLTYRYSCDIRVLRMMRERTMGNRVTQLYKKLQEQHSEAWLQRAALDNETNLSNEAQGAVIGPNGVVGWDKVQDLAAYLVGFREASYLTQLQVTQVIQLWTTLSDCDKRCLLRSIEPWGLRSSAGNRPSPKQAKWHNLYQKIEKCPMMLRWQTSILRVAQTCTCGSHPQQSVRSPAASSASTSATSASTSAAPARSPERPALTLHV